MKGVDVSVFNYPVDWQAVKDAGCDFAIVRCTFGEHGIDETFARNVHDAHAAGLKVGAYHYSYALYPDAAAGEAHHCKRVIADSGVMLELPIWFDIEDADGYKKNHGFDFTREHVTNICRAFIEEIQPLHCGVYASYNWLEQLIDWRSLGCAVWNAQWGSHDFIQGFMWQFTDGLTIAGKLFDGNILY